MTKGLALASPPPDKSRGSSYGTSTEMTQIWIVACTESAPTISSGQEVTYTENIEHQQSPEDSSDGSRHGLSRIGSFSCCYRNDLGTEEGEGSGDCAGPESKEVSP